MRRISGKILTEFRSYDVAGEELDDIPRETHIREATTYTVKRGVGEEWSRDPYEYFLYEPLSKKNPEEKIQ